MSKDEAIKLAIEVFKSATPKYTRQRKDQKTLGGALDYWRLEQHQKMKAIKALEEALAKQEQGEPVAYVDKEMDGVLRRAIIRSGKVIIPQQRKPLTDEQIKRIWESLPFCNGAWETFAREIEAAHGIKE